MLNDRLRAGADPASNKLPLGLLTAAQGHPMLVELKNGETLNGHLVNCDTWMNLTLKEVVQTSAEGDKFHRLPEAYVRGSNVRDPSLQKQHHYTLLETKLIAC
jgi:small nuclear ribonucleoprotein (snRNP)-like protein